MARTSDLLSTDYTVSDVSNTGFKIIEKPKNAKNAFLSAKYIKESINVDSPEVFEKAKESYFSLNNFNTFRKDKKLSPGNFTPDKLTGTVFQPFLAIKPDRYEKEFKNSKETDLLRFYGQEKYDKYVNQTFSLEDITEDQLNQAVNDVKNKKVQAYISNIDNQSVREKTEKFVKKDNLIPIFTDEKNPESAELYLNKYLEALDQEDQFKIKAKNEAKGKVDLTRASENLKQLTAINEGQGPAGKILRDFYKSKETNVLNQKKELEDKQLLFNDGKKAFEDSQASIIQDLKNLNVSMNSSEEEILQYKSLVNDYTLNLNSYNNAVVLLNEGSENFNGEVEKLNSISSKINDSNFFAKNFGLAYTFGDKALLSMEQGFTDMATYGISALAAIEEVVDQGIYHETMKFDGPDFFGRGRRAVIDYNESLKNYTQSAKPLDVKYKDLVFTGANSNFGEVVNQLMGNNIFSIGSALTYGGAVKLISKGALTMTTARASSILGNTFFGLEAGGKLSEMQIAQNNAQESIDFYKPKYEEALKNPDTPPEILLKYRQELDAANRALNYTEFEKAFASTLYGGFAKYAEKVGTMSYVKSLALMSKTTGPLTFSSVVRGGKSLAFNTGVEYTEEVLTLVAHNLTDVAVLGEDKSLITGLDADFNMNVLFSTLAIQAPSNGMNIYNAIASEVRTDREKIQNIKYRDQVVSIGKEIQDELNVNKTISGVPLEPSIESKQKLDYLRAELAKVLKKAGLDATYSFAEVANMSREDILELFEINRQIRAEGATASDIGSMQSGEKKSDYIESELQKVKDKVNILESKREELLKKPELRRKKDLEDLLGKENLSVEDYFFAGKWEQSISINRGLGKKVLILKDVKDGDGNTTSSEVNQLETELTKQVKNGKITEQQKKEYLNSFEQGANATYIGNTIISSQNNVYRNIQLAQGGLQKSIMAYSVFHEAMHQNDESISLVNGKDISLESKAAVQEIEKSFTELFKRGKIKEKDYNVLIDRINQYKFVIDPKTGERLQENVIDPKTREIQKDKDGKNKTKDVEQKYLAEIMPLLAELQDAGVIQENTNLEVSLRLLFNKVLKNTFGDNDMFFRFRDAKDISAYVASFRKGVRNLTAAGTVPEEKQTKVKESKATPLQAINNLLPNSVKTKEDYDNFISDGKRNKVLFDALKNDGVISNYVKARATSDEIPLILQNVSDRMIGLVGKGFDPTVKREDGTTVGNKGFGEYIFANTNFSQMDARKTLATRNEEENKTKRIDAARQTSEGEVGFDLEDTSQLSPEEQMIQSEDQQQLTPEQLESQIKKDLNLTDEVIEKVKQAVRKTYGTKLPDIRSKKYRKQLKDALVVELKKEIQDIFGREQDYNKFLIKYMPSLHNNLSADRLVQIERRVPKGKKIFVDSKRITSVKEVRKLQEQGLIRKDVKPASGPNLNTKLKTPSNKKIMAFFRGTNMQEVLGYTIKESAFGPRKDALAEAIVEKVGFDATINILNKELNVVERMRGVQEITGIEQLENDVQVIADVLNVNPNISLSLGVEITGIQVIEQFNDLLTLAQGEVKEFLDLETELKYKGVPILSAIYDPIKKLAVTDGGLLSDTKLNTALKKVFGSIVKLKGEKNLGDVGERVVYNLFKDAGFLAPGHQLSEKKVNIKPFFTFEGGKFQNADIVFVLDNGQEVALEIKFAASGVVNAGKITVSSYNSNGSFEYSNKELPQEIKDITDQGVKKVLKVVKEFEDLLISDFGYPKGTKLNDIYLPNISPYKSLDTDKKSPTYGKMINKTIFTQAGKSNIWHKDIRPVKAKSNFMIPDDGSVSTYLYNKKGNFYALFIGEGKGKGLHYIGFDPLNLSQELGITSIKGGHGVKARLLAESKYSGDIKLGYKFRVNVEAQFNTNEIEKTSGFNIRNAKNVQQFKKAVNKSTFAKSKNPNEVQVSKNIKDGKKLSKGVKGITVLDFDDTLATSKSLIKYTKPDGGKGTLTPEQYASTYQDLQDLGYEFDFSEFNKVVDGKIAPLFQKALKLQGKFGPENMFVLTARPAESAPAIFAFIKANGLNIPLKNITGLANSTSEAKALWMADKVGEGYNDFYFADDALQNVQAVDNMLNQFDVKRKVQQAKVKFSLGMDQTFNDIIENVTGIKSEKRFDFIKARKRGASKGKFRLFIPPSHEDFVGLLYNFMGKGKEGNAHRDFLEQALVRPLNRANKEYDTARQSIATDYKNLNKQFPDIKKKLIKKTPDGDFTYQDAIRIYLWDKHGYDVPGLSPVDQKNLVDLVNSDPGLKNYAETINIISKQETYVNPTDGWNSGDIRMDLDDATGRVGRAQFFEEFNENVDVIFSKENLNKIEAGFGSGMRIALEDIIYRIKTGRNRPSGQNEIVNKFMNYLNGSVGSVMFFNMRSALLQQMSIVNYINFADNNVYAAAKAFANQKQYYADWAFIFNSDMLKQRRGGIQTDINGAELAASIRNSKNPSRFLISKILEIGFAPTQIADNIAIATGGATYYRNRINTYLDQGLTKKEAEAKAFTDFQDITQSTQQSARPDMVSQQQASAIGKVILNFQNVTSQFNRLGKKAFLDIKNRRITKPNSTQMQSDISNAARITYYFAIQNMIFYTLQTAMFAMMFGDDEDDDNKLFLKKKERLINGSIDSVLRGSGFLGAVLATLKNVGIAFARQRDVDYNPDESAVLMEALNLSPVVGIKARKITNAEKTLNYNKNAMEELETFDIDNPHWSAVTNYIEAGTNLPLNRLYNKTMNVRQALNNDHAKWQRTLMFLGWSQYNLGIMNDKVKQANRAGKQKKKRPF